MKGDRNKLPTEIYSGSNTGGHCQGIAVDRAHGYIYYSFTTQLVKTDMRGNLIGSVTGLFGHLGCIDFRESDGRVYGSLEYKNDEIGMGILCSLGKSGQHSGTAFYAAVFDVDRIDRIGMDACGDGIMKTVYLKDVVDDYNAMTTNRGREVLHRFGCSGIDGLTFGRIPGGDDMREYMFVAYGVYGDTERSDNDCQVILCYEGAELKKYERPLGEGDMHTVGPLAPEHKFFVYTGNTEYGVQNLEYDEATGNFVMVVYRGRKKEFPNYPMFVVDGSKKPYVGIVPGVEPETKGEMLCLLDNGSGEKTPGFGFKYGSTGLCSVGNGLFYVSHDGRTQNGFDTHVRLYRWNGTDPLERVCGSDETGV